VGRMKRASRKALTRLRGSRVDHSEQVPGPSPDPHTNLIIADVVMRMGSYVMRRSIERGLLKDRYGKRVARDIVANRSIARTLASAAIARVATGSLPGAAVVTTGMAAKLLLDRSRHRQVARSKGDANILKQADRG